jgi:hypothetical protein
VRAAPKSAGTENQKPWSGNWLELLNDPTIICFSSISVDRFSILMDSYPYNRAGVFTRDKILLKILQRKIF